LGFRRPLSGLKHLEKVDKWQVAPDTTLAWEGTQKGVCQQGGTLKLRQYSGLVLILGKEGNRGRARLRQEEGEVDYPRQSAREKVSSLALPDVRLRLGFRV
jgi:hypothetical protein